MAICPILLLLLLVLPLLRVEERLLGRRDRHADGGDEDEKEDRTVSATM
jgi:hypothetical protein